MGLLGITPIVILVLKIYGSRAGDLPMLPGNRLLTGDARKLPGSTLIDCIQGDLIFSDFDTKKNFKPSDALTFSNFQKYPFISYAVVPGILMPGGIGWFSFAKLRDGLIGTRTAYVLQVDRSSESESAYWLPQGGFVDIPQTPGARDPKYVFTADYSGCSWTVTPMNNGMLRLRHVEGEHEDEQFNYLNQQQKGGPTTYAMQYKDYGYSYNHGQLIEHFTAYAYMHFSEGKWTLHVQHQTCVPRFGHFVYKNGHIETMKMNYFNQQGYSAIPCTEFWSIPVISSPYYRYYR